MNITDAIQTALVILGIIGGLAVCGLLGLQAAAWAWYRADGGKLGFLAWLRGI